MKAAMQIHIALKPCQVNDSQSITLTLTLTFRCTSHIYGTDTHDMAHHAMLYAILAY